MPEIHISDVLAFKACRRKWNFSSQLRSNLTPIERYTPFFIGSAVHYCLERHYRDQCQPERALASYLAIEKIDPSDPTISEHLPLIVGMVDHYLLWQSKDTSPYADNKLEFVALEQRFRIPLRTPTGKRMRGVYLAGRFDGLVRSLHDGRLYLHEIKTTRSCLERSRQLPYDEQTNAYLIAASEWCREQVAGVIYTLLRKKAPDKPTILKDGYLSQAKNQDTTAEYYVKAMKDHHAGYAGDPMMLYNDYKLFINYLLAQPNRYFMRLVVKRTNTELVNAANDLYSVAREMLSKHTAIYPHGSPECNYCFYREPCAMLNAGLDPAEVLATNYVNNTYHLREGD